MKDNKYTQFIKEFKGNHGTKRLLNESDLESVSGGVGGNNEATCPQCGATMRRVENNYGDPFWKCDSCDIMQIVSDAEYIQMIKEAEKYGQTQGLVYPVWWNQVQH